MTPSNEALTPAPAAVDTLLAGEERFRLLVDAVKDYGIVTLDANGYVVSWNAGAQRITGYTAAEIIGKHIAVLYTPDAVAQGKPARELEVAQRAGRFEETDWRLRKDGTRYWAEVVVTPLRDANGCHVGFAKVTRDLTERANAQEAQRQHSIVFETIGDGVLVMDLDGRISDMNPSAERLFGYSREELIGQQVVAVHDPALQGKLEESIQASLRRDGRWSGELPFQRKDGTLGLADVVVVARYDQDGVARGWIGVNRDITEQRRLENELRHAQKMEAVGQLAGGVAHDFNNLLTVIKAYTGLILDRLPPTDPLRDDAMEIQRAAGRAASLTQQLLAFSRKQILQPRVIDLNSVTLELEPLLKRLLGDQIRVIVQPGTSLGRVKADPGQIEQVLINLAVNARDAMPKGGVLSIGTASVELDDAYVAHHKIVAPGRYVRVTVGDTGIGMDEATRSRIFEPFFTTKPVGKGTGLGLSTVYGIVKQSNGYIWVYSEPGVGTTFKVYLPRLEAEEIGDPVAPSQEAAPLAGNEVVLLVEDEPVVRSIARRVLERQGYTVLEAPDGREALEIAHQYRQSIQLLVTDMMMPGMSGRDVWSALRTVRPELRVLFISGFTDDDMVRRGLLDRGSAFLQKPFTPIELARAARTVLDLPCANGVRKEDCKSSHQA